MCHTDSATYYVDKVEQTIADIPTKLAFNVDHVMQEGANQDEEITKMEHKNLASGKEKVIHGACSVNNRLSAVT